MKFLLSKLIQSVVKKAIAASVAFVTGPKLAVWLVSLGIVIDPIALSAGLFAAWEAFRAWATHQPWTPKWLSMLL